MDALKRAEASKQKADRNEPAAPAASTTTEELAGLSLEPLGGDNPVRGKPLPDLADHLDAVDADLQASVTMSADTPSPAAKAARTPSPPGFLTPDQGRETARTVFAAKIPEPMPPSRSGLWLALSALGLCAVGIGIYFWMQLSALNGGQGKARIQSPAAASGISITRSTPPPPAEVAVPVPTPSARLLPDVEPSESTESATRPLRSPARPTQEAESTRAVEPRDNSSPAAAKGLFQLSRTKPVGDPLVMRAWRRLQGGALEAARQDYAASLKNEPRNVDALLGLAVIAQRLGQSAEADRFFQLALEADPKNAAAQAAVIGLNAPSDPDSAESRLKNALAQQPESPSLNFALGNLYAREQRWNDAQQAYFNAVSGDGGNPDYLFNLAVSLDQLRQPKLATQFYQQALDAAEKRAPAFDREQIRRRLSQLAPP